MDGVGHPWQPEGIYQWGPVNGKPEMGTQTWGPISVMPWPPLT